MLGALASRYLTQTLFRASNTRRPSSLVAIIFAVVLVLEYGILRSKIREADGGTEIDESGRCRCLVEAQRLKVPWQHDQVCCHYRALS